MQDEYGRRKSRMYEDTKKSFMLCGLFLVLLLVGVVIKSHFEAKAFNRLTGKSVTTWEAIFVELRIDGDPNE